jgi:hypothetical protein
MDSARQIDSAYRADHRTLNADARANAPDGIFDPFSERERPDPLAQLRVDRCQIEHHFERLTSTL